MQLSIKFLKFLCNKSFLVISCYGYEFDLDLSVFELSGVRDVCICCLAICSLIFLYPKVSNLATPNCW